MGARERRKGRVGELACCHWAESLGWQAKRVSGDEAGVLGGQVGVDVEVGLPGETAWSVQVKRVAANCPSIPRLFTRGVTMAFLQFTSGPCRGRSFVVLDARDVPLFARQVSEGLAWVENAAQGNVARNSGGLEDDR